MDRLQEWFDGFRKFMMRGNVIDLAIAVVIGTAFGAVVNAFVKDILLQIVATMQMFVEAFILTNGGAGVNNNTLSVVNLIYQYAFALSGASNYNSASALGVVLMLVLAVFSGGYLWLTRQTDH